MYDGNPGEIDFGSSSREVRVSEGSSYRESTVTFLHCAWINHLITMEPYLMSCLLKLRDRLRHVEQSLTSSSQSTDQRNESREIRGRR